MFSRLKSWFTKSPPPQYKDAELGILKCDKGIWTGSIQHGERNLLFVVAGSYHEPNHGLLDSLRALFSQFESIERIAIEYLKKHEANARQAEVEFYGLELLDERAPSNYTFEFLTDGDDSQVWRVDFISGKPAQTGFDD